MDQQIIKRPEFFRTEIEELFFEYVCNSLGHSSDVCIKKTDIPMGPGLMVIKGIVSWMPMLIKEVRIGLIYNQTSVRDRPPGTLFALATKRVDEQPGLIHLVRTLVDVEAVKDMLREADF